MKRFDEHTNDPDLPVGRFPVRGMAASTALGVGIMWLSLAAFGQLDARWIANGVGAWVFLVAFGFVLDRWLQSLWRRRNELGTGEASRKDSHE